ncbi:ABC transporter ATP-binding protein [Iodidimonas muriae]|uniref:ABC transporter ATP-binding protein n=1 Tax=Iodidimonas muriae TaxID=261467 RepID=A0ABQ2L8W5_9PROT|nr:ATP-binding cassette domain-containing protein [Iodidimonas muriae]GER05870.1 ABC transporter ATP-binding protein [Kordiimonadales bacterium JCM 17843]GGO07216.1 ABC transporter ATP-binding protein [Iodidimonas muriae]
MAPIVELSNIHKRFGDHIAVEDVSMQVEPGQVYGFLGPNGAGKTTSIRIMLGIIDPDRGTRQILGAQSALSVSHRVGYLPEERGLYKNMSAQNVIAYLGQLKGMDGASAKRRAGELLERYGLADAAKKRVKQLSKGMAQKVQVLSTMVHDPDLVVLDEPFSGLDPVNQQVLEDLLMDMKQAGKTIIFSTHVMQHAERLCDRIGLIAHGRDVFNGTVGEAKRLLTPRILLRTKDDIMALHELEAVRDVTPISEENGVMEWEIVTQGRVSTEELVGRCMEHRIEIAHFSMIEPSLHEVFVHLVGGEKAVEDQNVSKGWGDAT